MSGGPPADPPGLMDIVATFAAAVMLLAAVSTLVIWMLGGGA